MTAVQWYPVPVTTKNVVEPTTARTRAVSPLATPQTSDPSPGLLRVAVRAPPAPRRPRVKLFPHTQRLRSLRPRTLPVAPRSQTAEQHSLLSEYARPNQAPCHLTLSSATHGSSHEASPTWYSPDQIVRRLQTPVFQTAALPLNVGKRVSAHGLTKQPNRLLELHPTPNTLQGGVPRVDRIPRHTPCE